MQEINIRWLCPGLKDTQEVLKDTFCKKLTLDGSVLGLMIPCRKCIDTFCKKLTPGGSVLSLMILHRKCLMIPEYH